MWLELLEGSSIPISKPILRILLQHFKKRFSDFINIERNGEFAAVAVFTHSRFKTSWMSTLSKNAEEKVRKLTEKIMIPSDNSEQTQAISSSENDNFFKVELSVNPSSFMSQHPDINELMRFLTKNRRI